MTSPRFFRSRRLDVPALALFATLPTANNLQIALRPPIHRDPTRRSTPGLASSDRVSRAPARHETRAESLPGSPASECPDRWLVRLEAGHRLAAASTAQSAPVPALPRKAGRQADSTVRPLRETAPPTMPRESHDPGRSPNHSPE